MINVLRSREIELRPRIGGATHRSVDANDHQAE
jgi:hypothetical protein